MARRPAEWRDKFSGERVMNNEPLPARKTRRIVLLEDEPALSVSAGLKMRENRRFENAVLILG